MPPNLVTLTPAMPGPTRPVKTQLPIGDAWGTNKDQRPVGQVTSDPTFELPHRQITSGKHPFPLQQAKCSLMLQECGQTRLSRKGPQVWHPGGWGHPDFLGQYYPGELIFCMERWPGPAPLLTGSTQTRDRHLSVVRNLNSSVQETYRV